MRFSVRRLMRDNGAFAIDTDGKSLRTVKSCVGSTWCRYGMRDSVGFAITLERRYRGLRSPHKLKGGVSGCVRECAEARGKDFGLIATDGGYNVRLLLPPRPAAINNDDPCTRRVSRCASGGALRPFVSRV